MEKIKKRRELIQKSKDKLRKMESERSELRTKWLGYNYDLKNNFPHNAKINRIEIETRDRLEEVQYKISNLKKEIGIDENLLNIELRKIKRDNRRKWKQRLQQMTLPAERRNKTYTEEELTKIFQSTDHKDMNIVQTARKHKRTYYAIEILARVKKFALKYNRPPKYIFSQQQGKLIEKTLNKLYDLGD